MITAEDVFESGHIKEAIVYGVGDMPVYVRVGDSLVAATGIDREQVSTPDGLCDVIVVIGGGTE